MECGDRMNFGHQQLLARYPVDVAGASTLDFGIYKSLGVLKTT